MHNPDRFSRQIVLEGVGPEGQERLRKARVAVVGVGALGSLHAELLTRAGVGHLVLVDRDVVEQSNLQRQHLYTTEDVGLPKVHAATRHLKAIWPEVDILPHAVDLAPDTLSILEGVDIILDGTDNWPTRWLLNDFSVRERIPFIYGAAIRTEGLAMAVLPHQGPCLACVFPPPQEGDVDTCDRVGVLNTTTTLVSTLQVQMALSRLFGWDFDVRLHRIDLRYLHIQAYHVQRREDCPVCVQGRFDALSGAYQSQTVYLCGRDTYQIRPSRPRKLDLFQLAATLRPHGEVHLREGVLRFRIHETEMLIFPDGRSLIRSPDIDSERAKGLYHQWVGE